MSPGRIPAFVVSAPGLEPLVADELRRLGIRGTARPGGISAQLTTRQLYAANLHLRVATRVVVRVARFPAWNFADFEQHLSAVDWSPWLDDDVLIRPRVSSSSSQLYHTGALAERLLGVLGHDAAPTLEPDGSPTPDATSAGRSGEEDPIAEQLIVVRVVHDHVTISIDSSGDGLHRRGWRGPTAKAPLRPTLAAAMLLSTGWDGTVPLIDPFCGSGTIPIEAARLARNLPPGADRSFAFHRWPNFEPGTWASVRGAAVEAERDIGPVAIIARDRDAGAVAATRDNAARAGVIADLDTSVASISDLSAPDGAVPGWVLTNPPYGRRVRGGRDLRDLYARFGQVVGAQLPEWRVGMIVDDGSPAGHSRLPLAEAWRSSSGGLPVRFLHTPVAKLA